jgi:hypothetical protein
MNGSPFWIFHRRDAPVESCFQQVRSAEFHWAGGERRDFFILFFAERAKNKKRNPLSADIIRD